MSGFDQSSIAVSMPTVVGADAALGGPYKIKPSEAFSGALMTVSGLTGETISVETSPDGYWGAPASPTFYRTDWQGTQQLYSTARTNSQTQSNDWGLANWNGVELTTTTSTVSGPDGLTSAGSMVESATATVAHYSGRATSTLADSTNYCASAWVKRGVGARNISFYLYDKAAVQRGAIFDLGAGSVSSTIGGVIAGVVPYANGWFRIWFAFNSGVGANVPGLTFMLNNAGSTVYTGDGVSSIYRFGAQIEAGSIPTPYIPTVATAVTVTDYTLSNGVITVSPPPLAGATLAYDNGVLPSPYYIFATGDGTRTTFAYDGVWGTLTANSAKGNGIHQIDLRGAQAFRLVKSAGAENATVNMTLKRDALQYKNTAGTWSVT